MIKPLREQQSASSNRREAKKPKPAKPVSIMVHVEGQGLALTFATVKNAIYSFPCVTGTFKTGDSYIVELCNYLAGSR